MNIINERQVFTMTLEYRGIRAAFGIRMAMICFEGNDEMEKAEKIVAELEKDKYWREKGFDWFDTCVIIPVKDRDDFDCLMRDYKKAKKAIRR